MDRDILSFLPLLVLGILANDSQNTVSTYDLAIVTHWLHTRPYFHSISPLEIPRPDFSLPSQPIMMMHAKMPFDL